MSKKLLPVLGIALLFTACSNGSSVPVNEVSTTNTNVAVTTPTPTKVRVARMDTLVANAGKCSNFSQREDGVLILDKETLDAGACEGGISTQYDEYIVNPTSGELKKTGVLKNAMGTPESEINAKEKKVTSPDGHYVLTSILDEQSKSFGEILLKDTTSG